MAHRKHVTGGLGMALLCSVVLLGSGCSDAGPEPYENRGRVIDQDTGEGIAGAIVVGNYMGSRGFEGSSSCNRIEGAVSDSEGWFTLPLDPSAGPILMAAYHREYKSGKSTRHAFGGVDGDAKKWRVAITRWDENNRNGKTIAVEPKVYHSEKEALLVSREWIDVYLRRFKGTRDERNLELGGLSGMGICGGGAVTSEGAVPFLEAIHDEYLKLGISEEKLDRIRQMTISARSSNAEAHARKK